MMKNNKIRRIALRAAGYLFTLYPARVSGSSLSCFLLLHYKSLYRSMVQCVLTFFSFIMHIEHILHIMLLRQCAHHGCDIELTRELDKKDMLDMHDKKEKGRLFPAKQLRSESDP